MTIYYSDQYDSGNNDANIAVPRFDGQVLYRKGKFSLSAALASADVINFFKLPADCVPVYFFADTDDLDTGGAPAITAKIGTDGDDNCFLVDGAFGQSAETKTMADVPQAAFADFSASTTDDDVILTVGTGPATGATSGDIIVIVGYMQDPRLPSS